MRFKRQASVTLWKFYALATLGYLTTDKKLRYRMAKVFTTWVPASIFLRLQQSFFL
jgi:hypothetical protein